MHGLLRHDRTDIPSQPAAAVPGGRIGALDGWRGMALLLVLVGHFAPVAGYNLGTLGVDCFFVLSGRLMAEILFVRQERLSLFFQRRFTRVYPALVVFVLLAAVLFSGTAIAVGPLAMATALSLTINYTSIYFHMTGLYDHLWSLCVEEHAYIALGITAWLSRRWRLAAPLLIAVAAGAALLNGIVQHDVLQHSYFQVFWRSDVQVAVIFTAALCFLWLRRAPATALYAWLAPVLFGLALLCKANQTTALLFFGCGTPLLALAVCLLEPAPRWYQRLLNMMPLRQIGIWSYSLYLWQQPFYKLHEKGAPLYWTLPAAIACGLASFYLAERPLRLWLNSTLQTRFRLLAPSTAPSV